MERHLTCIVCPKGCDLVAVLDENGKFVSASGATCKRGLAYAETECTAPTRTVTSTVRVIGGGVLPVKTDAPIPKGLIFDAMKEINAVKAPIDAKIGDVLIEDICGTGVRLVATQNASEIH